MGDNSEPVRQTATFGSTNNAFKSMLHLGFSDTYVCRTENPSMFEFEKFSEASDTEYSIQEPATDSTDSDDSESFSQSEVRQPKSEVGDVTDDTDNENDEHFPKSKEVLRAINEAKQKLKENKRYEKVTKLKNWICEKKTTYIFFICSIIFIIASIIIVAMVLQFSYLDYKSHGFKQSFFLKFLAFYFFFLDVIQTLLMLHHSYPKWKKSFYMHLLKYEVVLMLNVYVLIISYIIRLCLETIIRGESTFVQKPNQCYYILTIVMILGVCCLLSNKPRSIQYVTAMQYTIAIICFCDRVYYIPQLLDLVKYLYRFINNAFFGQKWITLLFGNSNVILELYSYCIESLISGFLLVFIRDFGFCLNEKYFRLDAYGIHTTTVVTLLQVIATALNPRMALFFSLPFMSHFSANEKHAVLTALFAAPLVNVGMFMQLKTYSSEMLCLLAVFPATKIICSFIAPMPYKHGTYLTNWPLHLNNSFMQKTFGIRVFMHYAGKIISCLIVSKFAISIILQCFHLSTSWVLHYLLYVPPALSTPELVVAVLVSPMIYALGVDFNDVAKVSVFFGEAFVRGFRRAQEIEDDVFHLSILYKCLRKMTKVSAAVSPKLITYIIKEPIQREVILPRPLSNMSSRMTIFLMFSNFNLPNIFMTYLLYVVLLPSCKANLGRIFMRACFSAFMSISLLAVIGGLLSCNTIPFDCKVDELTELEVCYNLFEAPNFAGACERFGGELMATW